jgi:hypothetical protein
LTTVARPAYSSPFWPIAAAASYRSAPTSAPGEVDLDPSQELILSADADGRLQWSVAENA